MTDAKQVKHATAAVKTFIQQWDAEEHMQSRLSIATSLFNFLKHDGALLITEYPKFRAVCLMKSYELAEYIPALTQWRESVFHREELKLFASVASLYDFPDCPVPDSKTVPNPIPTKMVDENWCRQSLSKFPLLNPDVQPDNNGEDSNDSENET